MADTNTTTQDQTSSGGGQQTQTGQTSGQTADGQSNSQTQTNQTQQPNTGNNAQTPISALPPDIQEYIGRLRREAEQANEKVKAEAETKRKADEAQLKEQNKFKELAELREKELADERAERAKLQRDILVANMVTKHGLKPQLAKFLTGATEAELDAQAAELAKEVKPPTAANTEGGSGGNGRTTGTNGSQQTGGQQETTRPYIFDIPNAVRW